MRLRPLLRALELRVARAQGCIRSGYARKAVTPLLLQCSGMLIALAFMAGDAQAQLRGHGGPVRALAISPDGTRAVSGSFDTSAIRWSLSRNVAEQVLRFHDGAVNAVAFLKDGRVEREG